MEADRFNPRVSRGVAGFYSYLHVPYMCSAMFSSNQGIARLSKLKTES